MQEIVARLNQLLANNLPSFLAAFAVLIVGWLIAFAAAAIVRGIMKRTRLDDRLAIWLGSDTTAPHDNFERWVPRTVYYVVLLFVLVAFLQTLGLTLVTEPLNLMLSQLFEFLPRILGAAAVLLVAWILATILRLVVVRLVDASKLEERLGGSTAIERPSRVAISATLGDAVYWLIFLLFLPGVLDTLGLQGLLRPVQGMLDEVLGFLPNLFAALLIATAGWFVARIVQQIVANLLAALGADQLSESTGLASALGRQRLSRLIGLVVYILILIPVLVAALNALELDAITQPASNMLNAIMTSIPNIFAATLVILIAYVVGKIVAGLITNLLSGLGFNKVLDQLGVGRQEQEGERSPAEIVGYLVLVAIILFASVEASRLLGFVLLADIVAQFLMFAGQVLLGLVIFGVGLYLANLAAKIVGASRSPQAGTLALATRVSILVLAGAMALRQMGLASDIINLAFGLLLGAVALSAALAFGLGGREVAARQLQDWRNKLDSR